MPRRIIINADDLGLSPSVNTAIFEVFRAGNLTSATLMVNMPGAQDAVSRLKDHSGLGVGLHFCITEGHSSLGASSLTDENGVFRSRSELAKASLQGHVKPQDVEREFEAQLQTMHSFGVTPSHTDSHQHVHMLPVVMDAILPLVQREGIALRLVDPPTVALRSSLGRPSKLMKQLLNRGLAMRARRKAKVPTNDLLVSIHDLDKGGPYDASTYAGLLMDTPGEALVEVMVHPYILGEDVLQMYAPVIDAKRPFLDRCVAEYEALRHKPVFSDAELLTYAAL